ncbi:ABC transporter ATP-binding protein [Roseobacter cerasinus]|uniref:ABC transporter ATP-binding protein n=1 Tax=Roseobacter cerasinus TaxID=2602289 RepID=A0A640VW20_9RHOB|nr:ABC transporter ATP-binding protein [Roseobacter cerasinus]GFE51804.1 ABC transporter ATP-binding protein [Roseobacter cerasinus]
MEALQVETVGMTMRFGAFTALDAVSMTVRPGTVHALLGENGAGKSTLVKCIMGFYHATEGGLLVNGREARIADPIDAQRLGLGMVYQHFTLVPSLTGAENLVISRADAPRVINWSAERAQIAEFLTRLPFQPELDQPVSRLSAGEKQKLEIVKQLYLGNRFLILDEPTSVLTPDEADEMLSHIRALCMSGEISVLLITHKFREVRAYADDVTILRRGRMVGGGAVSRLSNDALAHMMMGDAATPRAPHRQETEKRPVLVVRGVQARSRSGTSHIRIDDLTVHSGEIVGLAGISGNGQTELMEMLTGQRPLTAGNINVKGAAYSATRQEARDHKVRYLPEEPLKNAAAPSMSVAENLAFRDFDMGTSGPRLWQDRRAMERAAEAQIIGYNIKTTSAHSPISALSGGNVQRTVLARELSGDVDLLIVANPCFGLDFNAVAAIRERLIAARNRGVAILLISEDLDEIMELSDRLATIRDGQITFQGATSSITRSEIGVYMAGHA